MEKVRDARVGWDFEGCAVTTVALALAVVGDAGFFTVQITAAVVTAGGGKAAAAAAAAFITNNISRKANFTLVEDRHC